MFGYQLLHLTVAGLCTRSALCAIVPTADTQIGINPVNDLGPISAWIAPPDDHWIGVDEGYLTQGPVITSGEKATSTFNGLTVLKATATAVGVAVGEVKIKISPDFKSDLVRIAENACGVQAKGKRQTVSCAYEFAQALTEGDGALSAGNVIWPHVPTISSNDLAAIASRLSQLARLAKNPQIITVAVAMVIFLTVYQEEGKWPDEIAIPVHELSQDPYPTLPISPNQAPGVVGPQAPAITNKAQLSQTVTSCSPYTTTTSCVDEHICGISSGEAEVSCYVTATSCSPVELGCNPPVTYTVEKFWLNIAPPGNWGVPFKGNATTPPKSVSAQVSTSTQPLISMPAKSDTGVKACNSLNTPTFVEDKAAMEYIDTFCGDPDNLKADNKSVNFGIDESGKIISPDYMSIDIAYSSSDVPRIPEDLCKSSLIVTVSGCGGPDRHGGTWSNDVVTLTTKPLMHRATFFGLESLTSRCNRPGPVPLAWGPKQQYFSTKSIRSSASEFCSSAMNALTFPKIGDSYDADDHIYYEGQPEAIKLRMKWAGTDGDDGANAYQFYENECNDYVYRVGTECAIWPNSTAIYAYAGQVSVGGIEYTVEPQWVRQEPAKEPKAVCGTWYRPRGYKWEVRGAGWMTDEWGKSLRDWTNSDAGTEWNFAYTGDNAAGNNTDPEGMEWVGWGMYRVNTHTQDFIKDAVAGSKGPADCLNGNDNWPWPATSLKRRDQGEKEQ